jgi:hypothetical protein
VCDNRRNVVTGIQVYMAVTADTLLTPLTYSLTRRDRIYSCIFYDSVEMRQQVSQRRHRTCAVTHLSQLQHRLAT